MDSDVFYRILPSGASSIAAYFHLSSTHADVFGVPRQLDTGTNWNLDPMLRFLEGSGYSHMKSLCFLPATSVPGP